MSRLFKLLFPTFFLVIFNTNAHHNEDANENSHKHLSFTNFGLTVAFANSISISVDDLTINDVVGGDTIDYDVTMVPVRTGQRPATCSTTVLTLSSPGEPDITDITATVNNDCTILSLDGVLPNTTTNSKTFAGTITITYAYDHIPHN